MESGFPLPKKLPFFFHQNPKLLTQLVSSKGFDDAHKKGRTPPEPPIPRPTRAGRRLPLLFSNTRRGLFSFLTDDAYDEVVAAREEEEEEEEEDKKEKAFCVDRILDDCVRRVPS